MLLLIAWAIRDPVDHAQLGLVADSQQDLAVVFQRVRAEGVRPVPVADFQPAPVVVFPQAREVDSPPGLEVDYRLVQGVGFQRVLAVVSRRDPVVDSRMALAIIGEQCRFHDRTKCGVDDSAQGLAFTSLTVSIKKASSLDEGITGKAGLGDAASERQ